MQALQGGLELGQKVRGLQEQGNINRIAGQAAGASGQERTSLLNQMYQVNPTLAAQQEGALGKVEDQRTKGMVSSALLLANAPAAMRPELYQQMKPTLAKYGLQLPDQYDDTVEQAANALVQAYGGTADSMPSGLRQFQGIAEAAGLKSGTPEYQRAARVNLGLDPRAVTAAVRFDTFTDANGNPRPQRNNPTTGQVEIFIDESNQWQPLGGGISVQHPPHTGANTIFTTSDGAQIDVSTVEDPYVRQQILANPAAFGMVPDMGAVQLPDRDTSRVNRQAPLGIGIGQSKAAEMAAVEQAKLDVELGGIPRRGALETNVEADRADRLEREKLSRERDQKAIERAVNAADTLNLLANAERLLGDATGSLVGSLYDRANAVIGRSTEGARANAALKTLAGQLTSKMPRMEGPQSNSDVQMYKEMAGDLANDELPVATRLAALAEIRNINQKYAHLQGPDATPQQGSTSSSGGQRPRRARNPQTGQVVELRNGQWVPVE